MGGSTEEWRRQVEEDLLAAGFSASYACDTSQYVVDFDSEQAARLYRFVHDSTFMDDLNWLVACAYWDARANGTPPPSREELARFGPKA